MLASYKFWFIRRDDDGFIKEAAIRFYEGSIQEVDVINPDTRATEKAMRYVRSKRLIPSELGHLSSQKTCKESDGNDCITYTSDDFGPIKTTEELRVFLNGELARDTLRESINEQKVN